MEPSKAPEILNQLGDVAPTPLAGFSHISALYDAILREMLTGDIFTPSSFEWRPDILIGAKSVSCSEGLEFTPKRPPPPITLTFVVS